MKEITIYECEDGSRFDNRKEAAKYDKVLETVKQIMAPIGEPVTESYSAKQRDKDAVETTVKDFMQLCAWCIPDWSDTFGKVNELEDEDLQRYIVGRVLSDYSKDWKCLWEAYFRLSCISPTSYIEYEQPFWTSHEDEYQEELLKHNRQKTDKMKEEVKTKERGWASHFICAERCTFHRSTLIEYNGIEIVVSSVGAMISNPLKDKQPTIIGWDRYYETMVFYAKEDEFKDADAERGQLDFDCPDIPKPWDEINANNIHDRMVEKWKKQIKTLNH